MQEAKKAPILKPKAKQKAAVSKPATKKMPQKVPEPKGLPPWKQDFHALLRCF